MRRLFALILCMVLMLGLCTTALAEGEKAESKKTSEEILEEKVQEVLGNTADMTDDEIREEFRKICEESDIEITEKELDRVVKLCRTMELMKGDELANRVEVIANNFYQGLMETPEKFMNWIDDVENGRYTLEDAKNSLFDGLGKAADALSGFFGNVSDYFTGITTNAK